MSSLGSPPWLQQERRLNEQASSYDTGEGSATQWQRQAACEGAPFGFFHPMAIKTGKPRPGDPVVAQTRECKAICARCPVRADCLNYAMVNNEEFGIWGGLDDGERRQYRRTWLTEQRRRERVA